MPQTVTEKLIIKIATMDRSELVLALYKMDCGFRMDFTDEFLDGMSLERLRHVVLAAAVRDHCHAVQT